MKVGHLIRAERIRQEMKQIVLAKGVCTPSYLSKIERNLIEPSEEIALFLMNRLGIDPGKLQKNDHQTELDFKKLLKETYKLVITSRDEELTKQKLEYLEQHSPLFENDSLHYTYLLITMRLRLILGQDFDLLRKDIENLEDVAGNFDLDQLYLFKMNNGIYYYHVANLKKAVVYFEEALSLTEELLLEEWEKAELYYILGVAHTADGLVFYSIEFIRKALDYFREHFLMNRVLDCYVLIGIARKKNEQYGEALEAYAKAEQICNEFNLHSEIGIIYHNLGSLYGIMGNSEQAIHYYKQSINNKNKDISSQLISIFSLVMEYSKKNNKKLVEKWCIIGLNLFNQLADRNLTSYYHHFQFYKSLHSETGLSPEISIESIDYFNKIEDYRYVHKYCIALGNWYYTNRKYKLSSIYYREANRCGYIYRKTKDWEDL